MGRTIRGWLWAALWIASSPAWSQAWPSKPVRLVVPTSAGTATDLTARFLADRLGSALGASVIVENKAGANGIIATESVAKAPPDGHTLLVAASTHYINKALYARLNFDPIADFVPIARVNAAYLVLVAPPSLGVRDLAELTRRMKAQPRALSYATAGSGSTTHLAATLLTSSLGVEALHVPYKGGAQALTDTIGAQVQFTFTAIAQAAPHVRAGTLVPIATTGARRPASMPAVPTIAESGLPGYEIASRLGLMAPRGTPDEVVRKLGEAVERIARSAEFADFCQAQGLDVDYANAAAYAGAAAQELAYWASVVGRSGAKAD